jgi:tetratricopeptide (TPR) repeat protein
VPDPADLPPPERLGGYEAVQLFLARARARRPELRLTAATAPLVAAICARLDGLPLAIELAARVGLLPLEEIVARLDDRFRLLTGGPRTALPRQQTLRATLDWSYGLLDESERALLRRLAAFARGWTLEAAEAVGAGEGVDRREVLDLLEGLVRKSLVLVEWQDGEARYRLLETVREYGLERLAAGGEAGEVRRAHLLHFLALAEAAEPALWGPEQATWLERLERDLDNLRAVMRWAAEAGELECGLRLASALCRFWRARGRPHEGYAILSDLLARHRSGQDQDDAAVTGVAAIVRARALSGAGALAILAGQFAQATTLLEESVALFRGLGDRSGLADALTSLGAARYWQGEYVQATMFLEEGLALYRDLGNRQQLPEALHSLGMVLLSQGDYQRAALLMEESVQVYQALGDMTGYMYALSRLGGVVRAQGSLERAIALQEESLAVARQLGDTLGIAQNLQNLGRLAYLQGDLERARALYEEGLALPWDKRNLWGVAFYLEGVAGVTVARGHAAQAARLLGAAEALREAAHAPQQAYERDFYELVVARLRATLDHQTYAARWAAGRALPAEQAVAAALELVQSGRHPEQTTRQAC